MGHEVLQQRHELRHDRYHAGHRTAATEDVATLLDVGTAVYGEGHSRPAQPHSRPSAAAGENAPRQDMPLDWVRGVERLHRLPIRYPSGRPENPRQSSDIKHSSRWPRSIPPTGWIMLPRTNEVGWHCSIGRVMY